MKLKPLKKYKKPYYPELVEFLSKREALLNYIPKGWRKSKAIIGSLLVFLFGLPQDKSLNLNSDIKKFETKDEKKKKIKETKNYVAPIFIYGSGRGAVGCIVINPPNFLSEEEAIDVIFEILKEKEWDFEKKKIVFENIKIEGVEYSRWQNEYIKGNYPLEFELYSKKYNFAIKFVSVENYFRLGGQESLSTVQDYDTLNIAIDLKERIEKEKNINAAIFYDPIARDYKNLYPSFEIEKLKELSLEKLKKQVNDFVEWFTITLEKSNEK